jgi:ABC-type multidrug transport system fused ATPase/permease subunit
MKWHLAWLLFAPATLFAAERPWWEAEIRREVMALEKQNAEIHAAILAELEQQQSISVEVLRKEQAMALELIEARWRERDEAAIRAEIQRLSDISRPYFESAAPILDPFYQESARRPD